MIEDIKNWLALAALVISVGTFVWTQIQSPAKKAAGDAAALRTAVDTALNEIRADMIGHDRRVQKLEDAIEHMPVKDDIHRIELNLADLKVQLAAMIAAAEATSRTAHRVEAFLLESSKK